MKIRFDDYVERYDDHHIWSTICTECAKKFNVPQWMLDEAGEGICGVKGCNNTIDDEKGIDVYYIDMPDELVEPGEGELELNIYEGEKKMRVEKRMVTTTTEKTFYIAVDGKEFDDEQACKNYELNLKNIARDASESEIRTIPYVSLDANDYIPGAGCEEELLILKLKTDEHMRILENFLKLHEESRDLTTIRNSLEQVKKFSGTVDVMVSMYDGDAWCYGTVGEFLAEQITHLTKVSNDVKSIKGNDTVNVIEYLSYNGAARFLKVLTKEYDNRYGVYKFELKPDDFQNNPYYIGESMVKEFVEKKVRELLSTANGANDSFIRKLYPLDKFEIAFKKYTSI